MLNNYTYNLLLSDLKKLKGVGIKTTNLLKRKKINTIFDLLWKLPRSYTDRSNSSKVNESGNIQQLSKFRSEFQNFGKDADPIIVSTLKSRFN